MNCKIETLKTVDKMNEIIAKLDELAIAEPDGNRKHTIAAVSLKIRDLVGEAIYLSIVENFELDEKGVDAMKRTLQETERLYDTICEFVNKGTVTKSNSHGSSSAN